MINNPEGIQKIMKWFFRLIKYPMENYTFKFYRNIFYEMFKEKHRMRYNDI